MRVNLLYILFFYLFCFAPFLLAEDKLYTRTLEVHKTTYQTFIKEIRCMTCPNQTIADSQAPVALAMREEILRRMEAGESVEAIRAYLVAHYGERVLYKPALENKTLPLWWGPIGMLGVGFLIWFAIMRKR